MDESKLKPYPAPLYGLVLADVVRGCRRTKARLSITAFRNGCSARGFWRAFAKPFSSRAHRAGRDACGGTRASVRLPYLSRESVAYLVHHRNADAVVTAYVNPDTQKPKPLFAIWEPKSLALLSEQRCTGNASPQQFLMAAQTHLITPQPNVLTNIHTPDEHRQTLDKLHSKMSDRRSRR